MSLKYEPSSEPLHIEIPKAGEYDPNLRAFDPIPTSGPSVNSDLMASDSTLRVFDPNLRTSSAGQTCRP